MLRRYPHNTRSLIAAVLALLVTSVVMLYVPRGEPHAPLRLQTAAVATVPPPTTTTTQKPPERVSRSAGTVRRVTTARPGPTTATDAQLWALAGCESGHNRYTKGPFHSYFQWMVSTWRSVSGLSDMPEDHDYAFQAEMARRIPLSAWSSQFPACSRRLRAAGVI